MILTTVTKVFKAPFLRTTMNLGQNLLCVRVRVCVRRGAMSVTDGIWGLGMYAAPRLNTLRQTRLQPESPHVFSELSTGTNGRYKTQGNKLTTSVKILMVPISQHLGK